MLSGWGRDGRRIERAKVTLVVGKRCRLRGDHWLVLATLWTLKALSGNKDSHVRDTVAYERGRKHILLYGVGIAAGCAAAPSPIQGQGKLKPRC